MTSKAIMTLNDHTNNFYNLKTIDASDLMDNKFTNSSGDEEDEEDEEEEEEEEEEFANNDANGDNESEVDEEEEEDEEESEEEEDGDEEYGVESVNKKLKSCDQTGSDNNNKPRGRGKGNRKSRVNAFFDGTDGSATGMEGIRRKFHCSHCGNGISD